MLFSLLILLLISKPQFYTKWIRFTTDIRCIPYAKTKKNVNSMVKRIIANFTHLFVNTITTTRESFFPCYLVVVVVGVADKFCFSMSHSIYWTIFYVSNICVHYFVILPFHTTVFSFQDEVTRKKRTKERETGKQTFHFSASFKSVPTTTLTDFKKNGCTLRRCTSGGVLCALYLHACQVCLLYLCYVFRVVINSLVC